MAACILCERPIMYSRPVRTSQGHYHGDCWEQISHLMGAHGRTEAKILESEKKRRAVKVASDD